MKIQSALLVAFSFCACTLSQDADAPFGSDTEASEADSGESSSGARDDDPPKPKPPKNAVANVCKRIDECGFLPPGVRLSDCEDTTESCLEGGLDSERSDWELFAKECLELQNCFNFIECYEGLGTCELPVDVETTGAFGSTGTDGFIDATSTGTFEGSTSLGVDDTTTTGDPGGEDTGDVDPPVCGGPCNTCLECAFDDPCLPEVTACAANPDCLDLNDCYLDCNDVSCNDLCEDIFPGGVVDHAVLSACALDACASC
ncbi:MAG: hypothetical protein ACE37F_14425 [Nannocystaceae bacterium]|nr:hypothetical protein [bacterium]